MNWKCVETTGCEENIMIRPENWIFFYNVKGKNFIFWKREGEDEIYGLFTVSKKAHVYHMHAKL